MRQTHHVEFITIGPIWNQPYSYEHQLWTQIYDFTGQSAHLHAGMNCLPDTFNNNSRLTRMLTQRQEYLPGMKVIAVNRILKPLSVTEPSVVKTTERLFAGEITSLTVELPQSVCSTSPVFVSARTSLSREQLTLAWTVKFSKCNSTLCKSGDSSGRQNQSISTTMQLTIVRLHESARLGRVSNTTVV